MGRVYRPAYTARDGTRRKTKSWYCEWYDHTGRQRRKKGFTDKAATAFLLAGLEQESARIKAGMLPSGVANARRPLGELLAEYGRHQAGRGLSDAHRRNCSAYLPEVFAGCKWSLFSDITADGLRAWMRRKLAGDPDAAEKDRRTCSPATVNGYRSAALAFSKWAAAKCGTTDPLAGVRKLNEELDRRRSRRIPTPADLAALADAAERCPPRRGSKPRMVGGPERAHLYLTAAYTGFRASELASLTPTSFEYAPFPPLLHPLPVAVTVLAKDAKGGRTESVPVPLHMGVRLAPWLAGRPGGAPLWPGNWAANRGQFNWLARDFKRAGVDPFPFHAFRAFFVTSVIEAGATVAEFQEMARHRSAATSLKHYARVRDGQKRRLSDLLPPPAAEG